MDKKMIIIMILLLISSFFTVLPVSANQVQLSITTGPMGGGFYPMGGGIAEYLSKTIPDLFITAISSGGVDENLNRLDKREADIGLVSTGDAYVAFQGEDPYDHPYDNMRGMGILFGNWVEPYALQKSQIETYLDVKGKTVCAGSPGGSMHKIFFEICEFHGINPEEDFSKTIYLPADAALQAIKMGQADVVMEIAAIPTAGLTELSLTHDFQILKFAPGLRDKLVEENPKYLAMTIPAGTYKGIDEDIETVGMGAMWACQKDLSEELVYEMIKTLYSEAGLKHMASVHPAAKSISLENAAKWTPIPLHPGAIKFFQEQGLIE